MIQDAGLRPLNLHQILFNYLEKGLIVLPLIVSTTSHISTHLLDDSPLPMWLHSANHPDGPSSQASVICLIFFSFSH